VFSDATKEIKKTQHNECKTPKEALEQVWIESGSGCGRRRRRRRRRCHVNWAQHQRLSRVLGTLKTRGSTSTATVTSHGIKARELIVHFDEETKV
jgi:hypothetical protein